MPHLQFIDTLGGERMVVLPLKEYEKLCEAAEDLDDIHSFDEAKRLLAAGEDELIPIEFANRILDGENPVRVWREFRGMSIKMLAEKAKISAAYLSQIEGGSREGSITTMKALANALSLVLAHIIHDYRRI